MPADAGSKPRTRDARPWSFNPASSPGWIPRSAGRCMSRCSVSSTTKVAYACRCSRPTRWHTVTSWLCRRSSRTTGSWTATRTPNGGGSPGGGEPAGVDRSRYSRLSGTFVRSLHLDRRSLRTTRRLRTRCTGSGSPVAHPPASVPRARPVAPCAAPSPGAWASPFRACLHGKRWGAKRPGSMTRKVGGERDACRRDSRSWRSVRWRPAGWSPVLLGYGRNSSAVTMAMIPAP